MLKKLLKKLLVKESHKKILDLKKDTVIEILRERAKTRSAVFIEDHLNDAVLMRSREEMLDYAISLTLNGIILETGVFRGVSINRIAKKLRDRKIYGFDSFIGLSEDWTGINAPKGIAFDRKGIAPNVEKNVELISGWVEDTVPNFLQKNEENIALLHIDTDTYKPAVAALSASTTKLKKNTLILFDEFHSYPNFEEHEFKAWHEFASNNKSIEFKFIAFGPEQALIKIL